MRTTVTPSSESPEGISQQIVAADESLRKSFSGLPVEDILPEVERSLTEVGVVLPHTQVRDYAQHISDRADYEFVLP